MSIKSMTLFASTSLTVHLLRGVFGSTTLFYALNISSTRPVLAVFLGVATLIALRGCPVCWIVGLIETIKLKFK